jgi:hypothetical protein
MIAHEVMSMAVRKSKKIGTVVKGYLVLDSKHEGTTTYFYLSETPCWMERGILLRQASGQEQVE